MDVTEGFNLVNKQEARAEETKQSILTAAGRLFALKGFEVVTMREIAKEAGCSHTTIYIYFKDKEALLYALAMPNLFILKGQLESILAKNGWSASRKLKEIHHEMLVFCFKHRNMFHIFFEIKAERVDLAEPKLEINRLRNHLFGLLEKGLQKALGLAEEDERILRYARIYYFTLHGIIGTYSKGEESAETLMERLGDTFDEAVDVLLAGFQERNKIGGTGQ